MDDLKKISEKIIEKKGGKFTLVAALIRNSGSLKTRKLVKEAGLTEGAKKYFSKKLDELIKAGILEQEGETVRIKTPEILELFRESAKEFEKELLQEQEKKEKKARKKLSA